MESQKPTTRKRKQLRQPPRTPLSALTRSKTRIIHSPLARSADIHDFLLPDKKRKARSKGLDQELFGDEEGEEMVRVSVKDLRARRVFSKKPAGDSDRDVLGLIEGEKGCEKINGFEGINGFVAETTIDVVSVEIGSLCEDGEKGCGEKDGFERIGEGIDGFVPGNPSDAVSVETGSLREDGELRSEGLCTDLGGKGNSMETDDGKLKCDEVCYTGIEESVQTTPPPTVAVADVDVVDVQKGSADEGKNDSDQVVRDVLMTSNRYEYSNDGCGKDDASPPKVDRPKDSGFNRIPVLKPCSRLKIYKAPSSISYRRLLPFLMDIAKDRSCEVQTMTCTKGELFLEKKLPQHAVVSTPKERYMNKGNADEVSVTVSDCVLHETTSDACNEQGIFPEHQSASDTPLHKIARSPNENIASENQIGSLSQVDHIPSCYLGDLGSSVENTTPVVGSLETAKLVSLDNGLQPSPAAASVSTTCGSSACASVDLGTPNMNDVVPSQPQVSGQAKGILKRNPRGCRGLCSCLNCTSFRLHAERAFEFSRNQMHDAEELALLLMKELSSLRNMLETSVGNAVNNVVLPVHQIKEACAKASKAEDLARKRLSQMKIDLFVHCRTKTLQRPKVNFAPRIIKNISENSHAEAKPSMEQ